MNDTVKRRAFTLIELLVVIAIIALLLSVVLPSLRAAKMQARKLISTSNLRQIGIALNLYADDNKGLFPLTTHTTNTEESWVYTLAPYLSGVDEIRLCPADPQRKQRLANKTTSYVVNEYMTPLYQFGQLIRAESFHNLHQLKSPAQTITTFVGADERSATDANADHVHSRSWFLTQDPEDQWNSIISDIQPDRYKVGSSDQIDLTGTTLFLYADTQVKTVRAARIKEMAAESANFAKPAR